MTTLTINIGNQTTNIGLFKSDLLVSPKKMLNKDMLTLKKHLPEEKIDIIVIASVVPAKNEVFSKILYSHYGLTPIFITGTLLKSAYPELGADRVANLFGARTIMKPPLCVIDCGTATTIDVLSENSEYLGGSIMPGNKLESYSLHKNTALLPLLPCNKNQVSYQTAILGLSTEECIKSGVYIGEYYKISGFITEIKKLVCGINFIFTGGAGKYIANTLSFPYDEWLTLKGLYSISLTS